MAPQNSFDPNAELLVNDDDFAPKTYGKGKGGGLNVQGDSRLARINYAKTVLWYLDDSPSMDDSLYDETKRHYTKRNTLMKQVVKRMVKERMGFSTAPLSAFKFDVNVEELSSAKTPDDVCRAIDTLHTNGMGTHIPSTLEHMIAWAEAHPSGVNMIQAILVTDAEDNLNQDTVHEYRDRLRAAGIVLDVILISGHDEKTLMGDAPTPTAPKLKEQPQAEDDSDGPKIGDDGEIVWDDEDDDLDGDDNDEFEFEEAEDYNGGNRSAYTCAPALRYLSMMTNGNFKVVQNASQLEQTLITSGTRLCLPAPAAK